MRLSDIQFFKDGTAAVVTIDGDVWLVRGLHESAGKARWRRFASGLHEPMSLVIRDEEIFAFDRNGIWRLRDTDGDGEADIHELFSNAFGQTADMREFPSQVRLGPGGEFVISKGGQQATTQGKHNGSVLRISADGKRATVLGYGFRQPNIGVNPAPASSPRAINRGQYIPSTPLHIGARRAIYGFLAPSCRAKNIPRPSPTRSHGSPIRQMPRPSRVAPRRTPRPLSDAGPHWLQQARTLSALLLNQRGTRPQARAVVSITRAFEYPPLNGSINPADGLLYIAGFQILGWGNIIDVPAGLGRVRYTGAPVTIPREVVPMDRGVLLRFDVALDPAKARDPLSYSFQTWAYQRTSKYGSPQYKADGTPGQDALTASSAYLAPDGRSVFVGVPGLKPVMQLRIGWSLATAGGVRFDDNAYTTPYELAKFDPKAEGFGDLTVDLTPRAAVAQASGPVTVEEGGRLAQLFACIACPGSDPHTAVARSGPQIGLGMTPAGQPSAKTAVPSSVPISTASTRRAVGSPESPGTQPQPAATRQQIMTAAAPRPNANRSRWTDPLGAQHPCLLILHLLLARRERVLRPPRACEQPVQYRVELLEHGYRVPGARPELQVDEHTIFAIGQTRDVPAVEHDRAERRRNRFVLRPIRFARRPHHKHDDDRVGHRSLALEGIGLPRWRAGRAAVAPHVLLPKRRRALLGRNLGSAAVLAQPVVAAFARDFLDRHASPLQPAPATGIAHVVPRPRTRGAVFSIRAGVVRIVRAHFSRVRSLRVAVRRLSLRASVRVVHSVVVDCRSIVPMRLGRVSGQRPLSGVSRSVAPHWRLTGQIAEGDVASRVGHHHGGPCEQRHEARPEHPSLPIGPGKTRRPPAGRTTSPVVPVSIPAPGLPRQAKTPQRHDLQPPAERGTSDARIPAGSPVCLARSDNAS